MKHSITLVCLIAAGCSFGTTKENIKTEDSSVSEPVTLPEGLTGTTPSADTPPPVFTALNYDGTIRNQDDLVGHPTVLWFFPFAGTPG